MKVLIATGGTGGHVFPAQELGKELGAQGFEILFAGGKLNTNKYFKRGVFPHAEVASSSLFRGNFLWKIAKGIWQSLKLITDFSPDLVVGFGSFYTFPILLAAKLKKIPFVLFEPNAIPGKVNRFFSRWAVASAVQFSEAGTQMKGNCIEVKMPTSEKSRTPPEEARDYFYLAPDRFTFLVFGGSQGAQSINHFFSEAIALLGKERSQFQVIHVAGKPESAEAVRRLASAAASKRLKSGWTLPGAQPTSSFAGRARRLLPSRSRLKCRVC
jgi:UDP-N-acetylglucosamine--N-acetylmuramyl-(pentapeptide) pyrophosphoryl-undecaprenol N-acetylglucosamine transferase